jgi:FAD/FMN-containing dehydrogenase
MPQPARKPKSECRKVAGWERIREGYAEYLHDESRLEAPRIEVLQFPTTAEQVALAVLSARQAGHGIAVSGARTGITGAAVPIGAEEMISLEHMKRKPVVRRDEDGNWYVHSTP